MSNEKAKRINQGLPSSNKEPDASKAELHSLNQELLAVNNQLAFEVEQLKQKQNELENLMAATDVATLCLDRELLVRWFTAPARKRFRLTDSDRGRHIRDFAHDFVDHDLVSASQRALKDLTPAEEEVRCHDGRVYLRRVTPYRTEGDRIAGVAITLFDISGRKRNEEALREAKDVADKIIDTVRESTLVLDENLRVVMANETYYRTFQVEQEETEGRLIYLLGNGQWNIPQLRQILEETLSKQQEFSEFEVDHYFESIGRKVMLLNARRIDHLQQILLAIEDITEHRLAERRNAFLLQLSDVLRQADDPGTMLSQAAVQLSEFLHCDRVGYGEFQTEGNRLVVVAQHAEGLPELKEAMPLDSFDSDGLAELQQNKVLIVNNVDHDERTAENSDAFAGIDTRALVCIPQIRRGRLVALLGVGRREPYSWPREEISILREVAGRTWSALDAARGEQALRASEARFRSIFDNSAVGMAQVTPEGRFLRSNATLCEMLGYDAAEMKRLTYHAITSAEDLQRVEHQVQQLRDGVADTFTMEYRTVRKKGTWIWTNLTVSAIRNRPGKLLYFAGIIQDIHARKQAEERFRSIFESNVIGIAFGSLDGSILDANDAFGRLIGYSPTEICRGQVSWQEITPTEYAEVDEQAMEEALRIGTCGPFEKEYIHKHGHRVPIVIGGALLASGQDEMVAFALDLSRLKQAEAELKRLNESLEAQVRQRTEMLSMLQDITRSANQARTVQVAMKQALERISRYNGWQVGHCWQLADDGSEQMVSSGIWYATHQAEDAITRLDNFQQICQQHRFSSGEGLVGRVMQSGQPQWVDDIEQFDQWQPDGANHLGLHAAIAFPVTVQGEVAAVLEFFSDRPTKREDRFIEIMPDVGIQLGHVIERKELERQIADAAESEQRRMGRDIHDGVGQELTGLRMIAKTHAEVLDRESSPEAKAARRIDEGLRVVQKQLRAIIRDLLPILDEEDGLTRALKALASRVRNTHHIDCRFQCDQPVEIRNRLLATHLYRIGQEAVNNAVRHGKAQQIVIRLTSEGRRLELQVVDDGVGIETPNKRKTGIGLRSMAFRADLLGGKLTIEPGQDRGTVVTCTVPGRHRQ